MSADFNDSGRFGIIVNPPRCGQQVDTPAGYIDTCYRVPDHEDHIHKSKDHQWTDGDSMAQER